MLYYIHYSCAINEKGDGMVSRRVLTAIQEALEPFIGCDINVDANVGRKKIVPYEGVLEDTYPNLFVMKIGDVGDGEERRLSFSYVDLFTGNVEVWLHKNGRTYQLQKNDV